MPDLLTERLTRLAERGPHADPRLAVARVLTLAAAPGPEPASPPARHVARVAAGAMTVAAAAGVVAVLAQRGDTSTSSRTSAVASSALPSLPSPSPSPTTTSPAPAVTLKESDDLIDVPVTLVAGSRLEYWRFLPDLDVSWRQTSTVSTELCWRTPVGQGCTDDAFQSPAVGTVPTSGGVIFLVRSAVRAIEPPPTDPMAARFEAGPLPVEVTAVLSDGSTVTVEVVAPDAVGLGYARLALDDGVTVVAATSA